MLKTYKYRLKDHHAKNLLMQHAYGCNQVWNWCVAQHEDTLARYRAGAPKRRWLTAFDLSKKCNGIGKDLDISQQTVQQICHQFARCRDNHKRVRFRSSFGLKRAKGWIPFTNQSRIIKENSITYLGNTYRFFGSKRRPLPNKVKGGCFAEDSLGRWYVCFHVEVKQSTCDNKHEIGVDLGLKEFATLSDGKKFAAPKYYRKYEEKLAIAQRAGNKNRVKAIHNKIKNCRRDFHHKLSTELARNYALIAVGDVNPKDLARTRISKSVLDAGWSSFRKMLEYKANEFVKVDERFTTQTCSLCGSLPPERPRGIAGLGIREWRCSSCGENHDRDVNAAKNILALARGVTRPLEGS